MLRIVRRMASAGIRGAVLLAAALPLACGGGGGGAVGATGSEGATTTPPTGGLDSYSPFTVVDQSGKAEALTWHYLVNGGQPLPVEYQGMAGEVTFPSTLTVTFDPIARERTTTIPFGFRGTFPDVPGTVSGSGTATEVEKIVVTDGATRIGDTSLTATLKGGWLITSIDGGADAILTFDSPLDWFPDRTDLDQLPVGFVHAPAADVAGTATGTYHLKISGLVDQETPFTQDFEGPQRWEIVDHLASLEVQGRTYEDVAVVELTTVVPDLEAPNQAAPADTAIRMWFARGVGMIKASGAYRLWETPLDIELVSTSFE